MTVKTGPAKTRPAGPLATAMLLAHYVRPKYGSALNTPNDFIQACRGGGFEVVRSNPPLVSKRFYSHSKNWVKIMHAFFSELDKWQK